jgi:hypothetical protein
VLTLGIACGLLTLQSASAQDEPVIADEAAQVSFLDGLD